jgi:uncharacterized protein YegP (UPF0339 family)
VAKFEIYRYAGGEYRWRLRADNNEVVASGEGYRSRDDCEHAVDLIKEQAPGGGCRRRLSHDREERTKLHRVALHSPERYSVRPPAPGSLSGRLRRRRRGR